LFTIIFFTGVLVTYILGTGSEGKIAKGYSGQPHNDNQTRRRPRDGRMGRGNGHYHHGRDKKDFS